MKINLRSIIYIYIFVSGNIFCNRNQKFNFPITRFTFIILEIRIFVVRLFYSVRARIYGSDTVSRWWPI